MSTTEKKKEEKPYTMKGIPIHGYVTETGDFTWIPNANTCESKENALEIPKILGKISEDKRRVWAMRFDSEKAIAVCPIIRQDKDVSKVYAEFFDPYNATKLQSTERSAVDEGTK